jgi:hypothetical protein
VPGNLNLGNQYTHTNLAQARNQIAAQLQDSGHVHWSADEINSFIFEALREWNALTGFYRRRVAFGTSVYGIQPYVSFYDLARMTSLGPGFSYNVTDLQIMTEIQQHFMEPPNGVTWDGTDQFTYQQVVSAIQNALNRFLEDTGIVITWTVQPISPPPTGRIPLSDSVIDVRRVAWGV